VIAALQTDEAVAGDGDAGVDAEDYEGVCVGLP
jgi:hypothetical protein